MNESYSHSSFFIATARQNKDFQISQTLKLAWVLSSCMFLLHLIFANIKKLAKDHKGYGSAASKYQKTGQGP